MGLGWCTKSSRLISNALRTYNSKIPINQSIARTQFSRQILRSQNLSHQTQFKNPFLNPAKRFYHADKDQVYHFKPRGYNYKRFFQNPRNVFATVLIGSGIVITVYFGNLETVPYTKRTHFVILSHNLERELGESQFDQMKKTQFAGKILPPNHPDSIRVRLISQEIIDALQRGFKKQDTWSDLSYSPESEGIIGISQIGIGDDEKWDSSGDKWQKEEEILDDGWVQESRKKGKEKGAKSEIGHLEGAKWEVIVVKNPMINAFCMPGGKIVVFTGLLNHFREDSEIATIIGHEVGHAVARHVAEQISKNLWLAIFQLILYQFVTPDVVNTMSNLLLRLPFSRRMELEADYIGLLLVASAGYDPRVAPGVYEKLSRVAGESKLQDYLATHPSGKKRAQLLAEAKVMEEAMDIYREVQAGRGTSFGFL